MKSNFKLLEFDKPNRNGDIVGSNVKDKLIAEFKKSIGHPITDRDNVGVSGIIKDFEYRDNSIFVIVEIEGEL